MAPPKKPLAQLGPTARYLRVHPEARRKKQVTDTKVNRRPEQVQKRVEANGARRKAKALGVRLTGRDASHQKDGSIKFEDSAKNRGRRGEGNR
jgi:hypothetical protein